MNSENCLLETLFSQSQLENRISEIAVCINNDYKGKNPLVVGVLNGCFMFFADLVRKFDFSCEVDFIRASSYLGETSGGRVEMSLAGKIPVKGRDVILVEDILDTGKTLKTLTAAISEQNPSSIATAVLFDKPSRREVEFEADYCCFEIDDLFVVGFGLDFDEKYRTLPFVAVRRQVGADCDT